MTTGLIWICSVKKSNKYSQALIQAVFLPTTYITLRKSTELRYLNFWINIWRDIIQLIICINDKTKLVVIWSTNKHL